MEHLKKIDYSIFALKPLLWKLWINSAFIYFWY